MVHIRLRDTGPGIAVDDREHLFERGFTTKEAGHSGIGLHWCANALNAIGGRIHVESGGKGKGACFHVVFPKAARIATGSQE